MIDRRLQRRRLRLHELRVLVLDQFERTQDEWLSPSNVCDRLGLGHGMTWYRVALLCERLAHEGILQLRNPRSRGGRYFRTAE